MPFDIRTLLVAAALATAFCTAARFLLWRMHPHVPGLGRWAWAGLLATVALLLLMFRDILPESPVLSLSQLLIVAGLLLAWDGFRRFLGRPPLRAFLLLVPLVVLAVAVFTAHLQSSLMLRALANAITIAVISVLVARELLRAPAPAGTATRALAYVYLANAGFFLLRGASAMIESSSIGHLQSGGMAAPALFWWLCISVAVTLGMALMTGERLQGDLDRQARRDPLTGALNRRAFAQEAEKEVARARRNGRPLAILMMDLDHFKLINDRMGHATGDDILCRFVAVAERELRGEDVFCRFGGEEFVALLPDTENEQALAAAERLRMAFADDVASLPRPPQSFAFTVSIGIAEMQAEAEIEDALRRADAALYQAKAAGRDCCHMAAPPPAAAHAGAA